MTITLAITLARLDADITGKSYTVYMTDADEQYHYVRTSILHLMLPDTPTSIVGTFHPYHRHN